MRHGEVRLGMYWFFFVLFLAQSSALGQQRAGHAASEVVGRYIGGAEKRDLTTIIDLTYGYQQEVARIKAKNPQVLWPKLVDEYYKQQTATFSQQSGFWTAYAESMTASWGNPTQAIRASLALFPASCKWRISESRAQRVGNIVEGGWEQTTVYVSVSYPSWEDAPLIADKILKATILEFGVDGKTQLIRTIGQVSAGDEYRDDALRVVRVTWGWGPGIVVVAAGGVPPYICSLEVGALRAQKDCSQFYELSQETAQVTSPTPAHLKVVDSKGQSDEVSFTAPAYPGGLPPLGGYCWVSDPWYQRGDGSPANKTFCYQGKGRLLPVR